MREFTHNFQKSLVGLLLLILSAYYVNSSMFYHSHTIEGETILHSHIHFGEHGEDGSQDGGHTLAAAKLIAALSNITIEQQTLENNTPELFRPLESTLIVHDTQVAISATEPTRSLRAPPANRF